MSTVKGILFAVFAFHATLLFAPSISPIDDVRSGRADPVILERKDFVGPLAPNNKLDAFETLSTKVPPGTSFGSLKGPEAFAVKDDYLYTGIHGGEILRTPLSSSSSSSSWQLVYKHGRACSEQHDESACGRPLGMRFDRQGRLWVADSVNGLYRVDDVEKGTAAQVLDPTPGVNSVAVSDDGRHVYYTVASTNFSPLCEGLLELISAPSGQVRRYDTRTKEREVLLEGLSFANGIALGAKDAFLVVSDLGHARLLKFDLQKKTRATFANTPGMVDNISSNGKGGFLCGVILPLRKDHFDLYADLVLPYPMLARYLLRLDWVVRSLAGLVLPSPTREKFLYWMTNFETFSHPTYGLVVEYDGEGTLVRSWHSPTGKVAGLSEATLVGGKHLYLGSPFNKFAARIGYDD